MANVTFIIGNGLDLSIGLKTSYADFYEYARIHSPQRDNRIYKAIQESPEDWADFEAALGQYTTYIENLPEKDRKKESIDFHGELQGLMTDLANYLSLQEESADGRIQDFEFRAQGYLEELPEGQRNRINAHVNARGKIEFQFITLNYTKSLEKILANSANAIRLRGMSFQQPLHVHGDLVQDLTIGVSDESQLSSAMSGTEKDDLIKPSLIYSMNDGRIDRLNELIMNSTILVLFGTSLGETDKYIWEIVNRWLATNSTGYIIIHRHDRNYSSDVQLLSRRKKQFDSNAKDRLLRHSGLDGDAIENLRNRIFVIHNTNRLFTDN